MESEQIIQENNFVEQSILKNDKKNLATPELVFEWRKWYLKEGHSVHSTTTYFNYIKLYVGYGIEINQKTVNNFTNKSSCGASIGALKNFFNYLVKRKEFPQEILLINFDNKKSQKKKPNSIDPLEVQRLIDAMPDIKDKFLIRTIFELGLRISEALKLDWNDFSWIDWLKDKSKKGSVNLINTKGNKFRTIPCPSDLMNDIYNSHKYRDLYNIPIPNPGASSLIFDYGINEYLSNKEKSKEENKYDYIVYAENRFRILLYKISKEVLGRRINPHSLRHSKAQYLLNKGLSLDSLKEFLGHSSIVSTQIYAKSSAEKLKKDMEQLGI